MQQSAMHLIWNDADEIHEFMFFARIISRMKSEI